MRLLEEAARARPGDGATTRSMATDPVGRGGQGTGVVGNGEPGGSVVSASWPTSTTPVTRE